MVIHYRLELQPKEATALLELIENSGIFDKSTGRRKVNDDIDWERIIGCLEEYLYEVEP